MRPPFPCGNCGAELEEGAGKRQRRRVPRKGGRKLEVCPPCASAIDRQLPLDLDAQPERGTSGTALVTRAHARREAPR